MFPFVGKGLRKNHNLKGSAMAYIHSFIYMRTRSRELFNLIEIIGTKKTSASMRFSRKHVSPDPNLSIHSLNPIMLGLRTHFSGCNHPCPYTLDPNRLACKDVCIKSK